MLKTRMRILMARTDMTSYKSRQTRGVPHPQPLLPEMHHQYHLHVPVDLSLPCEHFTHLSQSAWVANLLGDHLSTFYLLATMMDLSFPSRGNSVEGAQSLWKTLMPSLPRSTSAVCLVYLEPNVKMALNYPVFLFLFMCCTVKEKDNNNPFPLKQIPAIVQYGLGGLPVFLSLW